MFYLSSLVKDIFLYPKDLSGDVKSLISDKIKDKIRGELEGTVIGNNGYIISIIDFNQASKGKIDSETGRVNYKIMYKAITFKPVVGEILNAFPFIINEHGFFCKVGHLRIFVSKHIIKDWEYNAEDNIWVLENDKIELNKIIKLKIIAFRIYTGEIEALGELTP